MDTAESIILKINELNKKNELNDEYSLGVVLLLDKFEKELKQRGYSKDFIESFSPSYYDK